MDQTHQGAGAPDRRGRIGETGAEPVPDGLERPRDGNRRTQPDLVEVDRDGFTRLQRVGVHLVFPLDRVAVLSPEGTVHSRA